MGRAPCCDKAAVKRGPWSPEEDAALKSFVQTHGTGGNWIALPRKAGLKRCGKSCRLRWLNYLRPDIKHGGFTEEEDNIICTLYSQMGSRQEAWSLIASHLPGRTDNDVKNYWNTKLKKKLVAGKVSSFNMDNNGGFTFPNAANKPEAAAVPLPYYSISSSTPLPILSDVGYGFSVDPVMQFSLSPSSCPNPDNSRSSNIVVVSSQQGSTVSDTGSVHHHLQQQQQQQQQFSYEFPYELINGEMGVPSLAGFSQAD
ncbi:hypothetical protein V6N13_051696 [Hibiscus sabdariffa]